MALIGKLEGEVELHTSAAKFFNFLTTQIYDLQNICDHTHEAKLTQGDWHGIGSDSVKQWTFTLDGKVATCKENFEEIDNERKAITFNLFDGDAGDKYKSLKQKLQVIDKANNGAVAKWTYEYEKLREDIPPPQAYLDLVTKISKDIDAHLIKA